MAVQLDYLQALIARDDVYDPSPPPRMVSGAPIIAAAPRARRMPGLDAVRFLATCCIGSWAAVAVETWLLVR